MSPSSLSQLFGSRCSLSLPFDSRIVFHRLSVYPSLSIRDVLPILVKRLATLSKKTRFLNGAAKRKNGVVVVPNAEDEADEAKFGKGVITQKYLWPRMQKFFQEGDVILAESGTAGTFLPLQHASLLLSISLF